jgi:transglutaminase-like putative cysteine protease
VRDGRNKNIQRQILAREADSTRTLYDGLLQQYKDIGIAGATGANNVAGNKSDGVTAQDAGHAWAEGFVPGLGWVAFDTANGICATDAHVRVAVGLDYLGAAPVRGMRYGGSGETLAVSVQVDQAAGQTQS